MAPRPRSFNPSPGVQPRQAGVLLVLYPIHIIHPFVAYTPQRPTFRPDPSEVAELLGVPLPLFMDPATRREEDWTWHGAPLHVPFYAVGEHKVWGATAIVLAEFLALLARRSGALKRSADM